MITTLFWLFTIGSFNEINTENYTNHYYKVAKKFFYSKIIYCILIDITLYLKFFK